MGADVTTQLEALGKVLADLASPISVDEVRASPPSVDLERLEPSVTVESGSDRPAKQPRWLAVAAALLLVVSVAFIVARRRTEPTRPSDGTVPATSVDATSVVAPPPTTDPAAAVTTSSIAAGTTTSVASTTTVAAAPELGFTPLMISSPPAGYQLKWARYGPDGSGGFAGLVRYVGQPDQPDLTLLIRPFADFFATALALGRQAWEVNGHTFIADGEGDGSCLPDVCSIGVQWDDHTAVSLTWTGPIGPEHTIDSLLAIAPSITTADAAAFEPGPLISDAFYYDINEPGLLPPLVVAGQQANTPAVIVDSGQGPTTSTHIPARIALALSDGRVLVEPSDGSAPFVVPPPLRNVEFPAPQPTPLWPEILFVNQRHLQDAVTINGRIWLLYTDARRDACTETSCALTVDLAPLDNLADITTVTTLDNAANISPTTRLTIASTGNIYGIIQQAAPATLHAVFDPNNIADGVACCGIYNGTVPTLEAIDSHARATVSIIDGKINVDSATPRTIELPAGYTTANIVGIDIAATDENATHGAIALSRADGTITLIDLSNGETTTLPETKGLATFG